MRTALIFITLCLIPGQVLCFKVFGCSGGSLMFKCLYSKQMKSNDQHEEMYFCRTSDCTTGISSPIQRRWVHSGRFALYDDENSRFFTVFIRNLSREDHGKYTCGKKQSWSHNVELEVNTVSDSRCGTSVVRDELLQQTVTFHCEYDHGFETHTKVLYRLKHGDPELVLNSSSQSSEEKFILSDSHNHHFNVTIRSLSQEDDGVYLCGVERYGSDGSITHITFIKEIHLNISSQITSVLVQAYSGNSVFIKCTFPQELKKNTKFIQKGESKEIPTVEQDQWERYGNVLMYDDTSEGLLKVFIRALSAADEATYRCGVNGLQFAEFNLKLKVDHVHPSSKVPAFFGESVNLTCNHHHNLTVAHICKENQDKTCQNIRPSEDKRFQFSHSPAGVFTVSISNVSARDAGVYWCGAETKHTYLTFISLSTKLELTLIMPPVIGREGASAEIRCPYDANQSTEIKYLCKGKCFAQDAQTLIRSDEAHVKNPKFSVNNENELFAVTVSDLSAEDAGIYWCGEKNTNYISTDVMIVTKAALVTHQASVGGSASISCKHIRSQTVKQKSFCRGDQPNVCVQTGVLVSSNQNTNGRFSLTDETSSGVFNVNISNLTAEDSGKYWCAEESSGSFILTEVHLNVSREMTSSDLQKEKPGFFLIVVVSVGLMLLVVCLMLMLLKKKCKAKHGMSSSSDRGEAGDHATAQDETQDSDPVTPLHSSVELPTMPSDELLYAAVSFQKHEESVSDATVAFKEDEIHCDYASVNHTKRVE